MSKTETPDIVTMLRDVGYHLSDTGQQAYGSMMQQAAAEIERLRTELAKHQWRTIYDEAEDTYYAPADTEILLGWWQEWPERKWMQEAGVHRSTKGGWLHSQATHWQPLPSPPGENDGGSTDGESK